MNDTRSFARVVLSATGIFFAIRLIPNIIYSVAIRLINPSPASFVIAGLSVLLSVLCIGALYYVFFYKRDWLAQKIIGKEQLPQGASQIPALPVVFRLIGVFAGLYCLNSALWRLMVVLQRLSLYFKNFGGFSGRPGFSTIFTGPSVFSFADLFYLLATIIIGVYLLAGAPHFVRWQVKKTLEQCKELEQTETPSSFECTHTS
jgi:hypothetical protein